jgi:two-component system NtrC family sensor kinase
MTNRRKDGSLFTEESIISPVRGRNGDIAAFVAAKRDLTEEVHLQTRLAQARNLETIGLIAGGVAHEVRNPLFAITTIVAALERKLADQPEFGEYVAHIKEQSSQLNQLMNDLLILGRPVEDAAFVPCELKDILGETHRQLLAVTASPHLCVLDAPKEPLVVRGIADKLAQVFLNVTGNAAAFSPEGQPIRIRLWREGDSAFVAVSDSGPGISEDLLPKIYQPFASKRKGGTGLGLAIVHKILEAHGGTVDARNNDPPPGATFTVRLPLASKEAPEGP